MNDKPRGADRAPRARRASFFKKSRSCPFSGKSALRIDYRDAKLLQRFVSEHGKMTPRRVTSVSAKKQRELSVAIKRARFLALLPYAAV